jgi:hypothetical protein
LIGVALFGAIFTNRLHANLVAELPHSAQILGAADPETIRHLPLSLHEAYISVFAASLQPVFFVAAGVAISGFLLTWLLPEVPLRRVTGAGEAVGETARPFATRCPSSPQTDI